MTVNRNKLEGEEERKIWGEEASAKPVQERSRGGWDQCHSARDATLRNELFRLGGALGDCSQTNKQITIRTTCSGYFTDLRLLEGSKQGLGVWLSRYITTITENNKRNNSSDM